jgi:hypothetical protein
MLRLRAIAMLVLLILVVYNLAPDERKRRWIDKLRELAKALALAMVLYWAYMLVLFFYRQT